MVNFVSVFLYIIAGIYRIRAGWADKNGLIEKAILLKKYAERCEKKALWYDGAGPWPPLIEEKTIEFHYKITRPGEKTLAVSSNSGDWTLGFINELNRKLANAIPTVFNVFSEPTVNTSPNPDRPLLTLQMVLRHQIDEETVIQALEENKFFNVNDKSSPNFHLR